MSSDNEDDASVRSSRSTYWLILCAVGLIFSDQNLLAPNLSAAAVDFGLDEQARDDLLGGGLAAGLFIVGGPAALLVGAAADGYIRRVTLLAAILAIGGCGCLGSALAQEYHTLFVARAITGVSLGGGLPLTFSLVGDMFAPHEITVISGRIGIAMSAGTASGQLIAGLLGPRLGWRSPFVIVGSSMMALALAVRGRMNEPRRRGSTIDTVSSRRPLASNFSRWRGIFQIRTVWLVFLQGLPGCVPWGVINTFLPDFLHANSGLTVSEASSVMAVFSIGGFAGMVAGSELGQRLYDSSVRLPAVLMLVTSALAILPSWLLIAATPSTLFGCCALAFAGGFLAAQTGPNIRATLSNVVLSEQRGFAFAAFSLFDDVGKGAGPVVVAALVRSLGRTRAFSRAMLGWLPCALLCGATALTVRADHAAVTKALAQADSAAAAVEIGRHALANMRPQDRQQSATRPRGSSRASHIQLVPET